MINLSEDLKYLLFVGSGRTGSSLVGQLLNYHPQILVSNEIRLLQRAFRDSKKISYYIDELITSSVDALSNGTRQYDRLGQENRRHTWQRDWVDISKFKSVEKKQIRFLGDKKQGGNTSIIRADEDLALSLFDIGYFPITVIRHPKQVFKSYLRIGSSMKEAADKTVTDMLFGYRFVKKYNGLIIRYESLLANPIDWCENFCKNTNIKNSTEWASIVSQVVNSEKKEFALTSEEELFLEGYENYRELLGDTKYG